MLQAWKVLHRSTFPGKDNAMLHCCGLMHTVSTLQQKVAAQDAAARLAALEI
jgi:hypothetical protein